MRSPITLNSLKMATTKYYLTKRQLQVIALCSSYRPGFFYESLIILQVLATSGRVLSLNHTIHWVFFCCAGSVTLSQQ